MTDNEEIELNSADLKSKIDELKAKLQRQQEHYLEATREHEETAQKVHAEVLDELAKITKEWKKAMEAAADEHCRGAENDRMLNSELKDRERECEQLKEQLRTKVDVEPEVRAARQLRDEAVVNLSQELARRCDAERDRDDARDEVARLDIRCGEKDNDIANTKRLLKDREKLVEKLEKLYDAIVIAIPLIRHDLCGASTGHDARTPESTSAIDDVIVQLGQIQRGRAGS